MKFGEFEVDISRPPIGPPNLEFHCLGRGGMKETRASKQRTRDYEAYIEAFRKELSESRQ